jgi:uncharacterized membrane protein
VSKFVVAVFSGERSADNEVRNLKQLRKRDRTLFEALAVVGRRADGKLSVKHAVKGASAAPAAALIGALAGFSAGGPAPAAFAAAAGALFGVSADLVDRGVDDTFIRAVARELSLGKVAIVADVPEGRIDDFHAQMEAAGGIVVQRGKLDRKASS